MAEATSDLIQATFNGLCTLSLFLGVGIYEAGGINQVIENAKSIPGFFEFFGVANPIVEN